MKKSRHPPAKVIITMKKLLKPSTVQTIVLVSILFIISSITIFERKHRSSSWSSWTLEMLEGGKPENQEKNELE